MRTWQRIATTIIGTVAAATLAAGVASSFTSTASATTADCTAPTGAGDVVIFATGGVGCFNADPVGSIPGDAIRACDTSADGFGIVTQLDTNGNLVGDRSATTSGHSSPFCSPWATGNLPEGAPVSVRVCRTKGGVLSDCSPWIGSNALTGRQADARMVRP